VADRRFAVVIGVDGSGVTSTLPPLRFAQRDASAVAELLCDPHGGTFNPKDVEVFTGQQTRAADVKAALRRIVLDSDASDVLLLYFAGHTVVPRWGRGSDLYLVTADFDESVLSHDPDAGLRGAFLTRDVLQHFKGTAVLILDCCRAGGLATLGSAELVSLGGSDDPRRGILAACAADEYTREDSNFRHGIFTYHVLEGLRGRAADARGAVTFETLSTYVCDQGLNPQPSVRLQARATTILTRSVLSGADAATVRAGLAPDRIELLPLDNPLDRHVPDLGRLINQLARRSRAPLTTEGTVVRASRVEYVRSALGADAVAYLRHTESSSYGGTEFVAIDATDSFDLDSVRHLLEAADGDGRSERRPLRGSGLVARDSRQALWCVPLGRADSQVQLLTVVNPPAWLLELGQPGAKVLQTIWHTDFAASPEESEIQVLTGLRSVFGRLPDGLFERCLHLYREVMKSMRIVFQPVVTIGEAPTQVGVHSYEALARRTLEDQSAPFALLQVAHTWGDHFVIERDKIILGKALTSYALAHANSPYSGDVPKPISVNVSVRSLLDDTYIDTLRELISELQLHANAITLEISEQDAIEPWSGEQWPDAPHTYFNRRLASIARETGVAFALDDFGAGHASLSRMAELPLTHIKVDRAILHHPQAYQELKLVVAVARDALDRGETHTPRTVIIEGVDLESPLSLREIHRSGIRHVQGYITGERGGPDLRRLTPEVRKDIAARVRGDDENGPAELARGDRSTGRAPLRRSA
jgi:EAL domain-containing protein (putative c-di-GMP-specific phosphodiesterase class I)